MNKINGMLFRMTVAMTAGLAVAGTLVNDDFESSFGDQIGSRGQWKATSTSAIISNKTRAGSSSVNAGAILPSTSVSNNAFLAASETNVWTDFWTIPRPYVSDANPVPEVDSGLSALFFVSNGYWVVVHGGGTNVITQDVWGTNQTAMANDGSTWHRVSVLHNYTAQQWSLFVEGYPVAVNKAFISATPVNSYEWFSVQNGAGGSSNVTWLDDVMITNRVPPALTADRDGDGMYDAWELMYYGNFSSATASADGDGDGYNNAIESYLGSNPFILSAGEPGGTNATEYVFNTTSAEISSLEVTNGLSMRLGFVVGSNRVYQVLRSVRPGDSYSAVGSFYTGPTGETNWWVDNNALNNDRYFYKLMATNGPLAATNAETYVFYRQNRSTTNTYYWVGIPVDYDGSNKLNSTLGAQLAYGLTGGANETLSDSLTLYPGTTYYVSNGKWYTGFNGAGSEATDTVPLGSGVLIRKKGAAGSVGALAGRVPIESGASVDLVQDWNFICWPYTTSNSTWGLGTGDGLTGDSNMANAASELWMYRNGNTVRLRLYSDNTWREWVTGRQATPSDWWYYMHPGDGVFVKKINAGTTRWTP